MNMFLNNHTLLERPSCRVLRPHCQEVKCSVRSGCVARALHWRSMERNRPSPTNARLKLVTVSVARLHRFLPNCGFWMDMVGWKVALWMDIILAGLSLFWQVLNKFIKWILFNYAAVIWIGLQFFIVPFKGLS